MGQWHDITSTWEENEPTLEFFPMASGRKEQPTPPVPEGFVPDHIKGDPEKNRRCGPKKNRPSTTHPAGAK